MDSGHGKKGCIMYLDAYHIAIQAELFYPGPISCEYAHLRKVELILER